MGARAGAGGVCIQQDPGAGKAAGPWAGGTAEAVGSTRGVRPGRGLCRFALPAAGCRAHRRREPGPGGCRPLPWCGGLSERRPEGPCRCWHGVAGRLCCRGVSAVRTRSWPWFGVTGVSVFLTGCTKTHRARVSKTRMEESNGDFPIQRDTILSKLCCGHVTVTNL